MAQERKAVINRKTNETDIKVSLHIGSLDSAAEQKIDIDTGIGFLDHMYHALAKHGKWSLT
ncbi:imidazoleglycerol-phosphate dehydratase, partial [Coemansia guatemalensis]